MRYPGKNVRLDTLDTEHIYYAREPMALTIRERALQLIMRLCFSCYLFHPAPSNPRVENCYDPLPGWKSTYLGKVCLFGALVSDCDGVNYGELCGLGVTRQAELSDQGLSQC